MAEPPSEFKRSGAPPDAARGAHACAPRGTRSGGDPRTCLREGP